MWLFRRRTYNDRYADNWREIAKGSHKAVKRICCLCCKSKSQEVHHVRYRDWKGAIVGRERSGIDVFPVCLPCHERLHRTDAWSHNFKNPVLGNRQKPRWVRKLKRGYLKLSGQATPFPWFALGTLLVTASVVIGGLLLFAKR